MILITVINLNMQIMYYENILIENLKINII
jgi:hypothetical protein